MAVVKDNLSQFGGRCHPENMIMSNWLSQRKLHQGHCRAPHTLLGRKKKVILSLVEVVYGVYSTEHSQCESVVKVLSPLGSHYTIYISIDHLYTETFLLTEQTLLYSKCILFFCEIKCRQHLHLSFFSSLCLGSLCPVGTD